MILKASFDYLPRSLCVIHLYQITAWVIGCKYYWLLDTR